MTLLEVGFDDATAVLALPAAYRKQLRTSNGVERINEEIRRRERVFRIFPNCVSAIRLIGDFLMEQGQALLRCDRLLAAARDSGGRLTTDRLKIGLCQKSKVQNLSDAIASYATGPTTCHTSA